MEQIRITKIIKTGTGLCVVIPVALLKALHLQRGDQVVLLPYGEDSFVVRKISDTQIRELKYNDTPHIS